jgi:hypothetical protein
MSAVERDPEFYPGDKKAEEIERDIAETRSSLTGTLEALEETLAPRNLLEKGLNMVRDTMDSEGGSSRIGEVIRDNPVPVALIGMGLGWLLLSKSGATDYAGRRLSDAASHAGDRVKSWKSQAEERYAHARTKGEESGEGANEPPQPGLFDRAKGLASSAAEKAGSYVPDVRGSARQVWDKASPYLDSTGRRVFSAQRSVGGIVEQHPLAVGALAFAAGIAIAAALPSTRIEDEWIGDTRDDLWKQAESAGRDMFDRAQEVAKTAADVAVESAREAIKEVSDEVQTVARDAVDKTASATREAAQQQGFSGDKPFSKT